MSRSRHRAMSKVTVAIAQRSRWQALAVDSSIRCRSGLMMFEDAAGYGKRAPIVISSLVVNPCRVVVIRRIQMSSRYQFKQLAFLKKSSDARVSRLKHVSRLGGSGD